MPKSKKINSSEAKKGLDINVDVKVNILHTIAEAIYSTSSGKVREAVANSRDNYATSVIITLDQTNKKLSILDNGHGITKERFEQIFKSIGYGDGGGKGAKEPKLSYFGLGLMSIFQLGNKIKLFTRPKDSKGMLFLEIDSGAMFDEENKDKSITHLSSFIKPLLSVTEQERRKASTDLLNATLIAGTAVADLPHFTEIIIEDIDPAQIEEMGGADFSKELTQLLPLRTDPEEPFFKRFTGEKQKEVLKLLQNKVYCKTIDVFFAVQEQLDTKDAKGKQKVKIPQLWKYFPKFDSSITFPDDNVYVGWKKYGKGETDAYGYYVVHTIGQDLHRDDEERDSGFWIRNQNFLVKSADFLDRPGPGRKPAGTIDKPLRNWVFGEIFHAGMTPDKEKPLLAVARNEFLYDNNTFINFRQSFHKEVAEHVNVAMRSVWEKRKVVLDEFVTPFVRAAENDGPFASAQNRLKAMLGADKSEQEYLGDVRKAFKELHKNTSGIEDPNSHIDAILRLKKSPLVLADNEDALVRVTTAPLPGGTTHEVRWDSSLNRVVVNVSPELFASRQILFLGDTYQLHFVAKKDTAAGVSINVDARTIYVNPFNTDLARYNLTILDVYLALEVADAVSHTKEALKRNFLKILSDSSPETVKYIAPLGDDLRRSSIYK